MALSAFDDKAAGPPTDEALAAVLGPAFAWWTELKDHLTKRLASLGAA